MLELRPGTTQAAVGRQYNRAIRVVGILCSLILILLTQIFNCCMYSYGCSVSTDFVERLKSAANLWYNRRMECFVLKSISPHNFDLENLQYFWTWNCWTTIPFVMGLVILKFFPFHVGKLFTCHRFCCSIYLFHGERYTVTQSYNLQSQRTKCTEIWRQNKKLVGLKVYICEKQLSFSVNPTTLHLVVA